MTLDTYRNASSGKVRNATKKHTAAPIKHPINPSSLYNRKLPLGVFLCFDGSLTLTSPILITQTMPHPHLTSHLIEGVYSLQRWSCRNERTDFLMAEWSVLAASHL